MRIRCEAMFPDEILEAEMVESPSRTVNDVRMQLNEGAGSLQLPPPSAMGTVVVEASPEEWRLLRAAGYDLKQDNSLAPVSVTYSYGNSHAPMGSGSFTIKVSPDNRMELVHQRYEANRTWVGTATPALWTKFTAAVQAASFPAMPTTRSAPPGSESFALSVTDEHGRSQEVSGFPSPEYRDVSFLFLQIVAQMSGDEVLGFQVPSDALFVADVVLRTD